MNEVDSGGRTVAIAAALIVAVVAVSATVVAYSYSGASSQFPVFVGWIFVALALLDVARLLRTPDEVGRTAHATRFERRDFGIFAWLAALLVLLLLFGFLISMPVFMIAFLRFVARRSIMMCFLISAVFSTSIWIAFIWLLDYRLFPGYFFLWVS